MAKKRSPRRLLEQPETEQPQAARPVVTAERFGRLYRLVQFLAAGPRTRERLTRHLRLDVRGFYRDLELLRSAGISVTLTEGRYELGGPAEEALARLPFPDPRLTLGEAQQLARGRTGAHQYLKGQIEGNLR
jgi:hypothetical protein